MIDQKSIVKEGEEEEQKRRGGRSIVYNIII